MQTNHHPRAAIVMLAFQTHCGEDCQRGNKHTQDWNLWHMVRAINNFFFEPLNVAYPIVIFHEDYNETQRRVVSAQTNSSVTFWPVDLSPNAIPESLKPLFNRVAEDVRPSHRDGNLSAPSMRGTFHGFGYRMMCRFFAGLIMWHAALANFDWYMRLDAGDSRLTGPLHFDPFVFMEEKRYKYGYHSISRARPSSRLDAVLRNLSKLELKPNQQLLAPFLDKKGHYNGRYYYNNFEIVHLPTFRSARYARLFEEVDRSGAFMLGDSPKGNLGDADFRSVAIAFILKPHEVHRLVSFPYRHPAPWNAPF